jgi:uncharacterized membrane protein
MSIKLTWFQKFSLARQIEANDVIAAIAEAETQTSAEIRVHFTTCKSNVDILDDAKSVFEHLKMHETENRNAVLIYLRLKTKEIAIIGDQGIHMHVGDSFWLAVKDEAIQTIKSHTITEGIRKAVLLVGKQLSRFFPPSDENPNELPNEITSGKI